jgi:hypothetical protein
MSTETAGPQFDPVSVVGAVIRYGFYLVGALVLGGIGLVILSAWRFVPQPVDDAPAFRIASSAVSQLPVSGHVISGRLGRIEVRQYGRLNNRDVDLAVVMVQPLRGIGMGTEFVQDLRDVNLLRMSRAMMSSTHYDLETRFGEFRATEMRVDTDGRWKNCLAFRSRFDSPSVYLTGWYCDATGSKPGPEMLACILDRFTLDAPLASKEADAFVRARVARGPYCSGERVTQTSDTGDRRMSPPSRWSQPSSQRRY